LALANRPRRAKERAFSITKTDLSEEKTMELGIDRPRRAKEDQMPDNAEFTIF